VDTQHTILFLCPHGAAKSVMAAAYCRRLADRRGLDLRVAFAGTDPDDVLHPPVVEALRAEGIDLSGQRPRRVTPEDLVAASRIISLGCELGELAPPGATVERWDDVPPPSQDLEASRGAIAERVARLVDELADAPRRGGPS
jgi:arsenate reductase